MALTEEHSFPCPYCCSTNSILIDITGENFQSLVTDCETCCKPIQLNIKIYEDNTFTVDACMN